MNFKHIKISDIDVIELNGEFDLHSAPDIKKYCKNLLMNNSKKLLFDLKNLKIIDSSGLATLASLYFISEETLARIKFVNASPESKKILLLTQMDIKVEVFESFDQAVQSFE